MTEALIIGGGIGGSATAMALHRIGIDSTLYEAYPTRADNLGGFFTVAPNGMSALRLIDAHEPVMASSFPVTHSELVEASGRVMAKVDLGELVPGVIGFHTLRRDHLVRLLQDEAVSRGVRIEWGKRLADAQFTQNGRVVARFTDGTEAQGDLLIGADGIHSPTRKVIAPRAPGPRYNGFLTVCGHAQTPSSVAVPPTVARVIVNDRAFFGHTTALDGITWWYATVPWPEQPRSELAATPAAEWRRRLSGMFAGGSTAVAVIEATGDDLVVYGDYYMPSLRTWHKRSMVVVGDAAHAVPEHAGQGAPLAIEDGVELARCLRDIDDVDTAFATFERLRRPRVERVRAEVLADLATSTAIQRLLQAAWKRIRPPRPPSGPSKIEWLYQYQIDWDAPVAAGAGAGDRA
jgi:2-polyprenyl-6-methoxyphenol hydroxylase-like FAD-dependent oxidoreductase